MKHIGPILKAARERQQASLRDLARRSGISAGTLSRLENSKMSNPSYLTIKTVSEVYGIAPALWFAKIVKSPLELSPEQIRSGVNMAIEYALKNG